MCLHNWSKWEKVPALSSFYPDYGQPMTYTYSPDGKTVTNAYYVQREVIPPSSLQERRCEKCGFYDRRKI